MARARAAAQAQPGLERVQPTAAKPRKNVVPVGSTRKRTDTQDADIPQGNTRVMKSTGPASEALEPQEIEVVDGPVNKDKLDELQFMNDILEVRVHDDNDPAADPIPAVYINGRSQFFERGRVQSVRRCFVERLARCKRTTYSQRLVTNVEGEQQYIQIPHSALVYPFEVISDPAGQKGRDWLNGLLKQGQ